jgi:hypothetical protein
MQTPEGTAVNVFVYASTLQSFDVDSVGPVGLLKRHSPLLESVAIDKYERKGAVGGSFLQITEDDLPTIGANETIADDMH